MSAQHTMEAGIPPVPLELLTLIAQTAYPLADFNDGSNFPSTNIYSSLAVNRFLFIFSLPPSICAISHRNRKSINQGNVPYIVQVSYRDSSIGN
ncbi:hypothetical protein CDAR_15161 [Caerostris darwini]|uniref:Uncharacterized protein n=1 Tax=Caerostris darwini TaxID=1538125 RepID=A0AAV4QMB3_9ARAC|nr:hypothetical protein CDAR_15161 [Caerostris darwini]